MKNNIKQVREQKGMTQKECAEALNITLRAWQTYEQGVSEPRHEILCKIADMFDVSLDYLLNRTISIPERLTQSEIDFENAIIERYKKLPEKYRKFFLQGVMEAVECYKQEKKNDVSDVNNNNAE
ncbi:MAG: helix-turn-helix domain-containing protein [Oscillospiraceae bacterium]|nr:helix-turn-helix domain-containing protein [Oscillospiraceae bacterium]